MHRALLQDSAGVGGGPVVRTQPMVRVLALFFWGLGRMGVTEPGSPGLLQVMVPALVWLLPAAFPATPSGVALILSSPLHGCLPLLVCVGPLQWGAWHYPCWTASSSSTRLQGLMVTSVSPVPSTAGPSGCILGSLWLPPTQSPRPRGSVFPAQNREYLLNQGRTALKGSEHIIFGSNQVMDG